MLRLHLAGGEDERMDPITAALAAGAAAGLTDVAAQTVRDAYGRLKAALIGRFPQLEAPVQALEARPSSQSKQGSLSEELADTEAGQAADLQQLARVLIYAIERDVPQAAVRANVDLERVKGEFLRIQRVTGNVRVRDAEATGGGITITDIGVPRGAGPKPLKGAGAAHQQITGSNNVLIANVWDSTITVTLGTGPRRMVPMEPAWIALGANVTSPARLLKARHGVVRYVPPGDLPEQLTSWSDERVPFSLRVLAGGAGTGKTRIAVELCRTLSERRWLTGLLKAKVDDEALDVLATTPTARLVVVDYAETRQDQLSKLLPILASQATAERPVRVLLTVRSKAAGVQDVRRAFHGHGDALDVLVDDAEVDLLSELPFGAEERTELFAKAVEAFSARLGGDAEAARRLLPDDADRALTSPLMVLIAGYLAVANRTVPISRNGLLEGVLEHEDRYWSATAPADVREDRAQPLRRRVIALATLAGVGGSEAETSAAQLLRLVPDLADASELTRRDLARWAHDLYPGPAWWNPVEPDLIGEHLVATTYGDQPEVLAGVLTNRAPDALVQPLRLLVRASRDHRVLADTLPSVVTDRIADLCRTAIGQALAVNSPQQFQAGTTVAGVLETLVSLIPPDPAKLPLVLNGFPRPNTVLSHLVVTLTVQLAGHYRQRAIVNSAFEPDLAMALSNLSLDLWNLGRREQALAAAEEAVEIRRRLAAANPAVEPELAAALNNLGMARWNLGRREQALEVAEEAIKTYRRLAGANPDAFEPDLAMALKNLSVYRSDLGRREDGLRAAREAIEIYGRRAEANPAFQPDLAMALNNFGTALWKMGHREEALAAAERVVEIRRRLADANPAAFEPDLGRALNNLAVYRSDLGREQALKAAEEAVKIYRRLAGANPAAFEPDLARALWVFASVCTADKIKLTEALAAASEAAEIFGKLARTFPTSFTDALRGTVRAMADVLDGLDRREEAADLRRSLDAGQ
jgi:tetratricopeptide (TPR) repeat protein